MSSLDYSLDSGAVEAASMPVRATLSSAIGNALEWLDFTIYGALSATVFPSLFFPSQDQNIALLISLAVFGVGFVARPLGGIVCGHLGDLIGRKQLLLYTLSIMGAASFLIGFLPTYASIGIWAPILLVTLRIIQGFSLGGEASGSQLMVLEHAPSARRGLMTSLVTMASPLSQILGTGVLAGLGLLFTRQQLQTLAGEFLSCWGFCSSRSASTCAISLLKLQPIFVSVRRARRWPRRRPIFSRTIFRPCLG